MPDAKPPEVRCPKCGSDQITANKKGFSGKKAVAGAVITGGVGLLAGTIGSNKVKITCLACGHEFRPGGGLKAGQSTVSEKHQKSLEEIEAFRKSRTAGKEFITEYKAGNGDAALLILKEKDPHATKYNSPEHAYNAIQATERTADIVKLIGILVIVGIIALLASC